MNRQPVFASGRTGAPARLRAFIVQLLWSCVSPLISALSVVQILRQIQPQHPFQFIGLVAALSLIAARPDHRLPFAPRDDSPKLRQKFLFLCPHLRQFIAQAGQTHLFIHTLILPYPARLPHFIFLCGVALNPKCFKAIYYILQQSA